MRYELTEIQTQALRALGREQRAIDLSSTFLRLASKTVLVAGAAGAIGQPLCRRLRDAGVHVIPTDVDPSMPWDCRYMDVTDFHSVLEAVAFHDPDVIVNLAAAKLAPAGEVNPWAACETNAVGVRHLLDTGRRIVQASTCKAVEPETAYGASKLLAERMVLNQGGTVVRYVNVPECGPSMLTIWRGIPDDRPIPVTPCTRFLMTYGEAVDLTVIAIGMAPGRYKLDAGPPVGMAEYATRVFPDRGLVPIDPRRGDRMDEPLIGRHEWLEETTVPNVHRVGSWHDQRTG